MLVPSCSVKGHAGPPAHHLAPPAPHHATLRPHRGGAAALLTGLRGPQRVAWLRALDRGDLAVEDGSGRAGLLVSKPDDAGEEVQLAYLDTGERSRTMHAAALRPPAADEAAACAEVCTCLLGSYSARG